MRLREKPFREVSDPITLCAAVFIQEKSRACDDTDLPASEENARPLRLQDGGVRTSVSFL